MKCIRNVVSIPCAISNIINCCIEGIQKKKKKIVIMDPLKGRVLVRIPIIKDRVVFSVLRREPRNIKKYFYFTIDNLEEFRYVPYYLDFGPPSIAQLVEFARYAEGLFQQNQNKVLHFYTSPHPQTRSNAFCYILVFRMLHMQLTPKQTIAPYKFITHRFVSFRDASTLPQTFEMTHFDILSGIYKAISFDWLDVNKFDTDEYNRIKQIKEGDMNWIIPHRLLACATPYSHSPIQHGIEVVTPETAIPKFEALGINHIVRLNHMFYDADIFKNAGFKHTELYFDDGTVPSMAVVEKFLSLCENEEDVFALHCKAGLGRTGTLAACLLIRKYGFTPREAIAWVRVCRPGSITGLQQNFVLKFDQEKEMPQVKPPSTPRIRTGRFNPSKGYYLGESYVDLYESGPKKKKNQFDLAVSRAPLTPRAEIKKPFSGKLIKTAIVPARKDNRHTITEIVFD
jgi:cell division cycle 14